MEESVTSFTLSVNLKYGGLIFIPEPRLDNAKNDILGFDKEDGTSGNPLLILLALVYTF